MSWKASHFAWTLVAVSTFFFAQARADILISEICDPRLDYANDRFIEIYNPGVEAVDLTGWFLVAIANGADAFTWTLSGLIDAGQALVAGNAITTAVFPVTFADDDWKGANINWNGKVGDGARLEDPFGTVTDLMLATGVAFENADLVRKGEIDAPNPVYTPDEWTMTPVERATDASPGVHQTATPLQGPVIAAIRTDPEWPEAGDTVHVLAEITDTGANLVTVALKWGIAATALPNTIDMSVLSGDTYRTATPVPQQSGGATVYYRVEAANDRPATTTSDLQSYALAYMATVHEIQGETPASPLDGLVVTTGGVVTACFGTTYVIQDGSGPWNGLWVRGATAPVMGDSVVVTGRVSESEGPGHLESTMLVEAQLISSVAGAVLPAAAGVSTALAGSEAYEGVLVRITDADCTDPDLGAGQWQADDGSGGIRIGVLGGRSEVTLGSTYTVSGPVAYGFDAFRIEPRNPDDVLWTADDAAPVVLGITTLNNVTLRVIFSEAVDPSGAGVAGNYSVPGLAVSAAAYEASHPDQVLLTLSPLETGDYTLSVSGVADLFGNVMSVAGAVFSYYSPGFPQGYYDTAAGLDGEALRMALHQIIRDHTAHSYDHAWTAYQTTDVRPDNGKVWDIYSDIPGGTPPYLYTFGVDEGGIGGHEGTGYTREHTWCKSWFGGEVSPMYTDLFTLFPCDTHMNGTRGIYAYGETAAPQLISQNGSRLGPSSVPGYSGTVFEPIDAFKGDLARAYMYFSTRYHTEDAGWPGGPAMDGAMLKPWALEMFLQWIDQDPVSPKEIDRNNAIYLIQGNRNPFVDRPEYVDLVFGSSITGIEEQPEVPPAPIRCRLYPARPNPFNPQTTIRFDLSEPSPVDLRIYDVGGRLVKSLTGGEWLGAGEYVRVWDGRDDAGRAAAAGVYFCRFEAGGRIETRKLTLVK